MHHVLSNRDDSIKINLQTATNCFVSLQQPILQSTPLAGMSFRAFALARQEVGKRRRNLCVTRDKRQISREGDTALGRGRRQCDEIRRGYLRVVDCRLPNVIVCLMMTLGCWVYVRLTLGFALLRTPSRRVHETLL